MRVRKGYAMPHVVSMSVEEEEVPLCYRFLHSLFS